MKDFLKKKSVKRIILLIAIIILFITLGNFNKKPITYRTTEVESGDVIVVVSGTGAISASESRKEISKVNARIEEIYFKEGENVKTGDIIAKLDSSDYEITVNSQANSLQQAQISKETVDRQIENLKIVSTANGFINNLNITEGSYVMNNTKVCDIIVPNKYEIELQFIASENIKIAVGDYASIFLTNSFTNVEGKVTYVSDNRQVLENGGIVTNVIITTENPNYVLGGLTASATITTSSGISVKSINTAVFSTVKSTQLLSSSTGNVMKLYVKENTEVKIGDVIAELQNLDLSANAQSSVISVENLSQQLEYSQNKLQDYTIRASIDGTITAQNIKVGDWITTGNLICTVSNMDNFEFLIPIDELDISKISLDNKVLITLDALPETIEAPIVGRITKLPLEGVSAGGVTDYYITISLPYVDGLRIAMNASADIIVEQSLNTLRIPVECVSKENGKYYVEVVNGEEIQKREIKVGIQNASYYEIISGLTKGESIIVPQQQISLF